MTRDWRNIRLRLETVTPLWMGGAAYQPELRPPSFRGCMRFWLRALLGGTLGEDASTLRKAEAAVFGDVERSSSVVVRIDGAEPRTGSATMSHEDFPGVAYMFWSVEQRRREAILPGQVFDLQLHGRPRDFSTLDVQGEMLGEDDAFRLSAAAMWLLLRLGGAGARFRRGAGVLRAAAAPTGWPENIPSPVIQAATPDELALELAHGLQTIRRTLPWRSRPEQQISSFDVLHPDVCQIFVVDRGFPTWWEALDWVGRHFLDFRRTHVQDASAIAELLTRGRTAVTTIQRALLGLPLVFFFKSIFAELTDRGLPPRDARRKASATVVPNRHLGRASPLLIRVTPLFGDPPRYVVTMLLFRSRFLPDRFMTIRPQDRSIRPVSVKVPENHAVVDQWFNFLSSTGTELRPVEFKSEDEHA